MKTASARRMASSSLQICALLLALGGFTISLVTTMSNRWKISDTTAVLVTTDWISEGLWMDCAVTASGSVQCRKCPYMLTSDSKCAWHMWIKSRDAVSFLLSGQHVGMAHAAAVTEDLLRTGFTVPAG